MKGFYKRHLFCVICFLSFAISYSQVVTPGTKLFMENEPEKAVVVLENELKQSNPPSDLYNYLGLAYSQTGNYEKAVLIFEKGIEAFGTNKKVLYYNLGNACYNLKDYKKACDSYSMSIIADAGYPDPYLNRANSYLQLNEIDSCISDYTYYLELRPNDPQEEKIRRLIALLTQEKEFRIAEQKKRQEEAERLKQEEERLAKAKAEQERIAREKKAEEEERRRKLLEDVANSLKQSSDTTNMSAGAEAVLSYDEESEID